MNLPLNIRALRPSDRARVAEGFDLLSTPTMIARFLSPVKARPSLFRWVDELGGGDHIAVGASHAETGESLGLARCVRDARDGSRAELAVTVVDAWQRRGVGSALVDELTRHARRAGITSFSATCHADNRGALALVRRLGEPRFGPVESGVTSVEVPLVAAPRVARPRRAAVAALASTAAVLLACAPASARTIDVTTVADTLANDGQCSVREAITAAFTHAPSGAMAGECVAGDGNKDTVKLGPGRFVLTRAGANEEANDSGDLDVRSSLTLQGAGAASTTIDANTIDRVIHVQTGARAAIEGVTVTRGKPPRPAGQSSGASGGGILSEGPQTLSVRDSVVTLNQAGSGAEGTFAAGSNGPNGANGGATGQVGGSGASVRASGGGFGGAGGGIASGGALEVERSTISENNAGNGGPGGRAIAGNGASGGNGDVTGGNGGAAGSAVAGPGGPGGRGGAISSVGPVLLADSTITLNASGKGGTGGKAEGGPGGNGGNGDAGGSGGVGAGGGDATGGSGGNGGAAGGLNADTGAVVRGSTIDHNTTGAGGEGGAAVAGSGGRGGSPSALGGAGGAAASGRGGTGGSFTGLNLVGASTVTNSTVTAQAAGPGGRAGVAIGGPAGGGGTGAGGSAGGAASAGAGGTGGGSAGVTGFDPDLVLTHVTVSANVVGPGGQPGSASGGVGSSPGGTTGGAVVGAAGVAGEIGGLDGTPRLVNSIVAGNVGGNCASTVVDGGHDVSFGDASCPGLRADPLLGELGDHGGPTQTRALADASPAVDVVPASGAGCAAVDQRGVTRPGGTACDAGAFEIAGVAGPPPPPPPPPPPADTTAPVFLRASPSPARFAVKRSAKARKGGTTFRYTLSEPARVSFTIARTSAGRKLRGKACVRVSRANRRRPHCTITRRVGRFTATAPAGATRKRFSGRLGGRALRPGRYRATLVATDAAGNASKPKRLSFTVAR